MRLDPNEDEQLYWEGVATPEYLEQMDRWLCTHGLSLDRVSRVEATPEGIVLTVYRLDEDGHRIVTEDRTDTVMDEVTVSSEDFPWPDWEEVARRLAHRIRGMREQVQYLRSALQKMHVAHGRDRAFIAAEIERADEVLYLKRAVHVPEQPGAGD